MFKNFQNIYLTILLLPTLCLASIPVLADTVIDNSVIGTELKPFWRKGSGPTIYPDWYTHRGAVTHDFFFNNSKSQQQNGADLAAMIKSLNTGDHLRIHAGTYSINSWFMIEIQGTATNPIFISTADGESVVITRPDAGQNTINMRNSRYVVMEGFEITNGSIGLRLMENTDHIMIHDLVVHDTAANGIAANSHNSSFLYFIDNELYSLGDTAEGFYLGSHDGSKVTHDTWVCGNYIHDLVGSNVTQGDGIEIKKNSYSNTIKYNYVTNTNYPGITLYGTGKGASSRNIVEENVVIKSNDNVVQIAAEAIIKNNLFINDRGTAFASQFHNGVQPKYLDIINNTFISSTHALRASSWINGNGFIVANNYLYSATGSYINGDTSTVTVSNNRHSPNLNELTNTNLSGSLKDIRPHPSSGVALIGTANSTYLPANDILGMQRSGNADIGARTSLTGILPANIPPLYWQHTTTGAIKFYRMNGSTVVSETVINTVADSNWLLVGNGDFNADGENDLFWRHKQTGENKIDFMSGDQIAQSSFVDTVADNRWEVAGIADFDGNGKDDILWRHNTNGRVWMYLMDGASMIGSHHVAFTGLDWEIKDVGDFDGDGKGDILWRNTLYGRVWLYLMNGESIHTNQHVAYSGSDWDIKGTGDFNGDGKQDIIWQQETTGINWMYLMNGTQITQNNYINTLADLNWKVAVTRDFDGDNKADIFWRSTVTGENLLYQMSGNNILNSRNVNQEVDLGWRVVD